MPRRKPNKASRKKQEETEPQPDPKAELRLKLKQKLREKQLERTSKSVRTNRMDDIEERLEESRDPAERHKLKEELALLEKIQEKEFNSQASEFPDYGDGCSYGGSMERPD